MGLVPCLIAFGLSTVVSFALLKLIYCIRLRSPIAPGDGEPQQVTAVGRSPYGLAICGRGVYDSFTRFDHPISCNPKDPVSRESHGLADQGLAFVAPPRS